MTIELLVWVLFAFSLGILIGRYPGEAKEYAARAWQWTKVWGGKIFSRRPPAGGS